MRSSHSRVLVRAGWLSILLLLIPGWLPAVQVEGLYRAEVAVAGQEVEQRNQAIASALAQVLVKVSGDAAVTSQAAAQELMRGASAYVQQYRYRVGSENDPQSGEPQRFLSVSFDGQAIERKMREAGLPVWGANRPGVLVWLGEERAGKRWLVKADSSSEIALWQAVEQAGRERGIPLLLPLMDLQDQTSLRQADLWGGFEQNLQIASARYAPDLVLTGRLKSIDSGLWRGDWTLFLGEGRSNWSGQAGSAQELARQGIAEVADRLAERYAPATAGQGKASLTLRVESVDGFADLVALERLLRSQNGVLSVSPLEVTPRSVTYRLAIRGSVDVLAAALELGNMLEPLGVASAENTESDPVDLLYRLR